MRRVLLLSILLPACSLISREPRPDGDPLRVQPWQVRCSWVYSERRGLDAQDGWVWATDESGRTVLVDGGLEDGFVRVDRVRVEVDDDEAPAADLAATVQTVRDLCAASIRRENPDLPVELDAVAAARRGENIDLTLAFASAKPGFSRLVIFGDSLSDPGNLKRRLLVFPGAPYWLGRFTDGPNWSDWLVRSTDLAVQNHAYGGAVATPHDAVPATSIIAAVEQGGQHFVSGSVDQQIDDYIAADLHGAKVQRPWETIFLVWAGANDYLSKEPFSGDITTLLDAPRGEAGYDRIVDETVAAIAAQVHRLYDAGARVFAVIDLPDLGETPIVLHNTSYRPDLPEAERRVLLSRRLSALSATHNRDLRQAMAKLAAELPSATITMIDAKRALDRMLADPGFDYGFERDGLERTVHDGRTTIHIEDRCYSGGYLGSDDPAKVCSEASRAVFWNAVHPSSFTNCWIAWFVRDDLAHASLLEAPPPRDEYRRYCESEIR